MNDRSWMLNPKAIRAAKECINIVKDELNVKLTLSHEEFLPMLYEYVDLTDSEQLAEAYQKLVFLAGPENTTKGLGEDKPTRSVSQKVIPILEERLMPSKKVAGSDVRSEEMVEYMGKSYPRYSSGKEFKGIYRGQPRYT